MKALKLTVAKAINSNVNKKKTKPLLKKVKNIPSSATYEVFKNVSLNTFSHLLAENEVAGKRTFFNFFQNLLLKK